ncbi:MAG TPA: hypothetical protein VEA99_06990 [Gemmatimonadaceae bacterium]|nr:hypothetical protein [Gemmatimonadaceae bacterium]
MLALRASRLIRAAGYVLLLCLGFLAAETVVADACDGDGRAAGAASHMEASGTAGAAHAVARVARDAGAPESDADGGTPGEHSMHVDHCSHPHAGGVIASAAAASVRGPIPARVAVESDREPPSASPEPLVRPPVA